MATKKGKPAKSTKPTKAAEPVTIDNGMVGRFTVKRVVTVPTLKLSVGETRILEILESITDGKARVARKGEDGNAMKAARVMKARDVETKEVGTVVLNKVLESILTEDYPDEAYVGKLFAITKGQKAEGKAYFPFTVLEVTE